MVRGDVRFAGGTESGLSGRLYSEVEPIEDQPLSIGENGWASFLLQRDYRDYYEREGIAGSAYVLPISTLRLELSPEPGRRVIGPRERSLVAVSQQRPLAT